MKDLKPLELSVDRDVNGNILVSHFYNEGPINMEAVDALTEKFRGLLVTVWALDPEETEAEHQLRRDWLDKHKYLREGWGQHIQVLIQGQVEDPWVVLERKREARKAAEQDGK